MHLNRAKLMTSIHAMKDTAALGANITVVGAAEVYMYAICTIWTHMKAHMYLSCSLVRAIRHSILDLHSLDTKTYALDVILTRTHAIWNICLTTELTCVVAES